MFVFFDMADHILFVRDDAESATWSEDQMSLQATFPYKADKEITRGMRVGFQYDGAWQVFEIRKAKAYEPDHYQEITAESIAISELTDEVYQGDDVTDQTASATLSPMLTNTLWQVGTVTASNTSSVDVGLSNVWNHVRNIEQNWNVIITPRVTVGSTGITGRYLDIAPNEGTWRGVRLSLEKNADDLGVVWDDTDVKTALYAYGAETDGVKLTFAEAEWTATSDHPAKPEGQTYLEDPTAKSLYGRNGRNRFGYYQNSNIRDAETLLEKTWESLKTLNAPRITVNCTVRDLHRLGYADQPIRLHDKVIVEIRPQGKTLVLDVIKLDVDLLDPTATRPTIGAYIPNIVFIDRETAAKASGGYGKNEGESNQIYEFETQITYNGQRIDLEAYQRQLVDGQLSDRILTNASAITLDSTKITSLVTGTGAQLGADGHLVVDPITGDPVFTTAGGGLYSKINQNAQAISLKVSQGDVATELAVECGNVTISGGDLVVQGMITATDLSAGTISAIDLGSGDISAGTGDIGSLVTNTITSGHYVIDDHPSIDLINGISDVQIVADGSGYKLQYKQFLDSTWTDAGTFSRAAKFSGAWNGSGTYTVTADPNGVTSLTVTPGLRLNGTGAATFSAEMLNDDASPTVEKTVTGYLHQNGGAMGVYTSYESGTYSGIIASESISGYHPNTRTNAANNLTQVNAISTSQATQMYAYVNGTLTSMGSGFWYRRQTYLAPTTYYY